MDTHLTQNFGPPFGTFTVTISDTRDGPALSKLDFGTTPQAQEATGGPSIFAHHELAERVWSVLRQYFAGEGLETLGVPLTYSAPPFTAKVLEAMRKIPFGQTRTYGEIAADLDNPGGARAVGQACNTNPIPIFIPCHRVLDSAGKLHGYAGGLELKRALLAAENCMVST